MPLARRSPPERRPSHPNGARTGRLQNSGRIHPRTDSRSHRVRHRQVQQVQQQGKSRRSGPAVPLHDISDAQADRHHSHLRQQPQRLNNAATTTRGLTSQEGTTNMKHNRRSRDHLLPGIGATRIPPVPRSRRPRRGRPSNRSRLRLPGTSRREGRRPLLGTSRRRQPLRRSQRLEAHPMTEPTPGLEPHIQLDVHHPNGSATVTVTYDNNDLLRMGLASRGHRRGRIGHVRAPARPPHNLPDGHVYGRESTHPSKARSLDSRISWYCQSRARGFRPPPQSLS